MINTIFFGINILLIYVIWTYCLKPSIIDHYRDKLFDLRDEVREFYLQNGISLSEPTYQALRDLLNGYISRTEELSMVKIAVFSEELSQKKALNENSKRKIEAKFKTKDKVLKAYIESVRERSTIIVMEYVTYSTPAMMLLLIALIIPYCISRLKATNSTGNSLSYVRNFFMKITTRDKLEDYSFGRFSVHA